MFSIDPAMHLKVLDCEALGGIEAIDEAIVKRHIS
jgi:hypothetical protein